MDVSANNSRFLTEFIQTRRREPDETHISAQPTEARTHARLSLAHVLQEWPQGAGPPPRQGPQAPFSLIATPPVRRLKRRAEFLRARQGVSERRKSLVVQARMRALPAGGHIGEGFTATKRVGNAVIRNRAKRRLRAAAQALLPQYGRPGCDYVFIARRDTATIGWPRLLDDMKSALISLSACLDERSGPCSNPPSPERN